MKIWIRPGQVFLVLSLLAVLAAGLVILETNLQAAGSMPLTAPTPAPPPLQATPTGSILPSVSINTPVHNSVVPAGDVTISANVLNFNGASKFTGYIFYYMDVEPPTTPSLPATTTPGTYVPTTQTSYTWYNVPPGTHTFAVSLVNQDFTPLVPPVMSRVTLQVTESGQIPATTPSPTRPATVTSGPSTVPGKTTGKPGSTTGVITPKGTPTTPRSSNMAMWVITGSMVAMAVTVMVIYAFRRKNM